LEPAAFPLKTILDRHLPNGGFCEHPGGAYRTDSTAWAVLCLKAYNLYPEVVSSARQVLCKAQLPDGNIPLTPDYPEAYWPTAIAAMALADTPEFSSYHEKTINFLLNSKGNIFEKEADSPVGHDTTIEGWSWIQGTHSWVEPTAMAIRALCVAGEPYHERTIQGVLLLLDRQLPNGGWNYGNTTVYGKTLKPIPTSSGIALWALAGLPARDKVEMSIKYLSEQLPLLRTPNSIAWAILGLRAWGITTQKSDELISASLQQQGRYSPYGTSQLSVLLAAAICKRQGFCL